MTYCPPGRGLIPCGRFKSTRNGAREPPGKDALISREIRAFLFPSELKRARFRRPAERRRSQFTKVSWGRFFYFQNTGGRVNGYHKNIRLGGVLVHDRIHAAADRGRRRRPAGV